MAEDRKTYTKDEIIDIATKVDAYVALYTAEQAAPGVIRRVAGEESPLATLAGELEQAAAERSRAQERLGELRLVNDERKRAEELAATQLEQTRQELEAITPPAPRWWQFWKEAPLDPAAAALRTRIAKLKVERQAAAEAYSGQTSLLERATAEAAGIASRVQAIEAVRERLGPLVGLQPYAQQLALIGRDTYTQKEFIELHALTRSLDALGADSLGARRQIAEEESEWQSYTKRVESLETQRISLRGERDNAAAELETLEEQIAQADDLARLAQMGRRRKELKDTIARHADFEMRQERPEEYSNIFQATVRRDEYAALLQSYGGAKELLERRVQKTDHWTYSNPIAPIAQDAHSSLQGMSRTYLESFKVSEEDARGLLEIGTVPIIKFEYRVHHFDDQYYEDRYARAKRTAKSELLSVCETLNLRDVRVESAGGYEGVRRYLALKDPALAQPLVDGVGELFAAAGMACESRSYSYDSLPWNRAVSCPTGQDWPRTEQFRHRADVRLLQRME